MRQKNQVRSPRREVRPDAVKIGLAILRMPVLVFGQIEKFQSIAGKAEELTTRALLVFPQRCLSFRSERAVKPIFYSTGARSCDRNVQAISIFLKKPHSGSDRIKIIRVWCQNNQAQGWRPLQSGKSKRATAEEQVGEPCIHFSAPFTGIPGPQSQKRGEPPAGLDSVMGIV
jgi:hypothetical protein